MPLRSRSILSLVLIAIAGAAAAQTGPEYPNRPIRMVLGYAPGGTTDIFARLIGAQMAQSWGQQVVVDNRAGASAQIATDIVAKAAPDGYTLTMGPSGTHTANPSLFQKLPYDTLKDFASVVMFASVSNMIVTHPSSPIRTLDDLIRIARAKPDQITYATSSAGSVGHLSAELLNILAGIRLVHVPYKGGGPALAAIASNEVNIMFAAIPSATPFVQSKRIRPIVQTAPRRAPALPDVPTVAEAGLPGLAVTEWYGVFAPARTPQPVINRLNAEINRIMTRPDIHARFVELGADPLTSTPQELTRQVETDIAMWAKVIRQAGLKAQ